MSEPARFFASTDDIDIGQEVTFVDDAGVTTRGVVASTIRDYSVTTTYGQVVPVSRVIDERPDDGRYHFACSACGAHGYGYHYCTATADD